MARQFGGRNVQRKALILAHLAKHGPMIGEDVARDLGIKPETLRVLLNHYRSKGYLASSPAPVTHYSQARLIWQLPEKMKCPVQTL